ncbi:MAG: hypothetical protein WAN86_24595 [Hyphomicrobiaceae bacterium]
MRLSIYDQFVVGVIRPNGGWSKGRPIAFIEEDDRCVPLFDLLIPNDLDDKGLARFVSDRFAAFTRPGKRIIILDDVRDRDLANLDRVARRRGAACPALVGVQH